jgi:hypothetical protein
MASDVQELVKRMYLLLDDFTCNGEHVSSLHGCVTAGGELCSGAGTCAEGQCACNSGREGKYCEAFTSSSDDNRLTILLGTTTSPSQICKPPPSCVKQATDNW